MKRNTAWIWRVLAVFAGLSVVGALNDGQDPPRSLADQFGVEIPVVTTIAPPNPNLVSMGSCNSGVSFLSVGTRTVRIANNRLGSIQVKASPGVDGLAGLPREFKLPNLAAVDFTVDSTKTVPDLIIKADGQHSRCRGYPSFVESQGLVPVSCERFDISPPTQARCYGTPE